MIVFGFFGNDRSKFETTTLPPLHDFRTITAQMGATVMFSIHDFMFRYCIFYSIITAGFGATVRSEFRDKDIDDPYPNKLTSKILNDLL